MKIAWAISATLSFFNATIELVSGDYIYAEHSLMLAFLALILMFQLDNRERKQNDEPN